MPFRDLGAASGGCRCSRCGRRCRQREAKVLRCLLGLCFLGMLALALPVLYFLSRRFSGKPAQEEIPLGRMPDSQRQQGIPPYDGPDPNFRPSIHVEVNASSSNEGKCLAPQYPALSWYKHKQDDEGQIKLDEGIYLIIPKDGSYFVYSQVTFFCPDGTCEGTIYCGKRAADEKMVSQIISYQTSAYGTNQVFTSSSSISETKWSKTLYVGGIIPLKKDDKLMVNVSNPKLIHRHAGLTFFGAYLISER